MAEDTPMADENTIALETPAPGVFIPPSINKAALLRGDSYTYFSIPPSLLLPSPSSPSPQPEADTSTSTSPPEAKQPPKPTAGPPCVLGVDEAGRGPVLGPMVYGIFFLPLPLSDPLLRTTHHFDDSKVLTPAVRSALMQTLCTPSTTELLHTSCGWAISALSARDIGAGMLRPGPGAAYNLNAQAMDTTVALIQAVYDAGVNIKEIYVDTIGPPATYQKKLERVFPTAMITVAKKADSLYPSVSAASVCAKVTRDAALETLWRARGGEEDVAEGGEGAEEEETPGWGSGYPSDGRCTTWMRGNMHPVFGWGAECRFSWGTAKDMLEASGGKGGVKVEWPVVEDEDNADMHRMTDFFVAAPKDQEREGDELGTWFGTPAGLEAF